MKRSKNNHSDVNSTSLRDKAENQLKMQKPEPAPTEAESLKLLHELQVHQIELEMINEELKLARDKAEKSAERYEELYDFAPAGYITLLPDGKISELNLSAAAMLGSERSKLLDMNFRNFVSKNSLSDFDKWFSKINSSGAKFSCELQLNADGSSIFVYAEGKIVGNPEKCIFSMIDITKRREAEENLAKISAALTRSNAELNQFAYAASHDLQEPLRMISSYTSLLAVHLKDTLDSSSAQFIEYIIDGARRMSQLINDLLEYARITTRKSETSTVDLNSVLSDVLKDLHLAITESGSEITSDQLPVVKSNSTMMHQLFQNLIANAIKFRDKKPVINITVERVDSEFRFCVRDNGIGIDPIYAERIFVIFQQLNSKEQYPGTGIGLALCRKIVELHGGKIWVESEDGKGTAFYFTLPTNNREIINPH